MTINIMDSPWNTTRSLPALAAVGVTCVIRYMNHHNSTKLPEKLVTPAEAAAIRGAGLKLALVFEQGTDHVGALTAPEGRDAAERAFDYSTATLARPRGRPIYFAIDFDPAQPSELAAVTTYFQAVHDALAARPGGLDDTPVGVYGSGLACETLQGAGLARYFWLAQSTKWQHYHRFLGSGHWHLLQGFKPRGSGINLDFDPNYSNAALPDFGAF
ncbi:MAG TPA: glycoside hydrolase domain-containing protein [Rhizomicrobium sp.]